MKKNVLVFLLMLVISNVSVFAEHGIEVSAEVIIPAFRLNNELPLFSQSVGYTNISTNETPIFLRQLTVGLHARATEDFLNNSSNPFSGVTVYGNLGFRANMFYTLSLLEPLSFLRPVGEFLWGIEIFNNIGITFTTFQNEFAITSYADTGFAFWEFKIKNVRFRPYCSMGIMPFSVFNPDFSPDDPEELRPLQLILMSLTSIGYKFGVKCVFPF